MTPSRSKTTASITRAGSRRRAGAAAACRRRARRARRGRGRSVWSPASSSPPSSHSSQPTAPSSSGPRVALPDVDARATSRSAARRGRSAARARAGRAASSETAKPPASRSSSCNAAWRAIEIPTSGGSSASETSDATVRPSRVAVDVDGDDGDPDGVAPHHRSQLVAARHGADVTAAARRPCRAGRRRGTASASRAAAGRRPCRTRRARRPPSRCPA